YRAAALARGRLIDVMTVPRETKGSIGSLYLGRVVRRVAAMNAAFVEIGLGAPAFLNVAKSTPEEGKAVVVQLVEAAASGKAPRVSTRLAIEGRFLVLLPREKGVAPSRRLGKADATRLTEIVRPMLQSDEGVVLRAHARTATAASLQSELSTLRSLWRAAAAQADGTPPRCLHAEPGLRRVLCAFDDGGTAFIFGDAEGARLARAAAATIDPEIVGRIQTTGEGSDLFERGDVGDALASAEAREVPLPSGGRIAIETTAALVAVDVDSGSASADVLATNLEAAAEVARQLRLRELGGTVLVDFIRMPAKAGRDKVERLLAETVAIDRMPVQLLGWTRGGLFELVRGRNPVG
ncbi:MAG TPA: ribonuclease E/G, partial [Alphaproteobacteria bacterium]|nr:ribonuclease E/G [Alphaproteobacteria bacterium]